MNDVVALILCMLLSVGIFGAAYFVCVMLLKMNHDAAHRVSITTILVLWAVSTVVFMVSR